MCEEYNEGEAAAFISTFMHFGFSTFIELSFLKWNASARLKFRNSVQGEDTVGPFLDAIVFLSISNCNNKNDRRYGPTKGNQECS